MVAADLKKRQLTQIDIAEKIGVTRQTVAGILASNEYFSDKQAVLFSLAYGYNRSFLTSGEGTLIAQESEYGKDKLIESQTKLIDILHRAWEISSAVIDAVVQDGSDGCSDLIKKERTLSSYVRMIEGIENLMTNPELMDGALKVFNPLCEEVYLRLVEHHGILPEPPKEY
jgi:transcriptional regulator with XRE-family HTH domain